MKINSVGVVGLGYVGGAIANSYTVSMKLDRIHTYDINPERNSSCNTLQELVDKSDLIYVCVPTPMRPDGSCDTSIVDTVVASISDALLKGETRIVVIKSTVPPTTTQTLQEIFPNLYMAFSPEFLTEANYILDYLHQDLLITGFSDKFTVEMKADVLAEQVSTLQSVRHVSPVYSTEAEICKYVANCFLAMKVSFANEMQTLTESSGVSWHRVADTLKHDARLGRTHWNVPGPDGMAGFGGTCFPKDINALMFEFSQKGIAHPILQAVWERNIHIDRPEQDWQKLKGRAVT